MPWHVPFHRVEAAAAAAKVRSGEASHHQSSAPTADSDVRPASHQPAAGADVAEGEAPAYSARTEQRGGKQNALEGSGHTSGVISEPAQSHEGSSPDVVAGMGSGQPDVSEAFLDGQIDKAKRTVVFKRYYHLYDKGELEGLVEQVPHVKLVTSFFDKSNWCAIFEKV